MVEKRLGRYLEKQEIVHHLNGVKTDNSDENLELIASQSEHMKQHAKFISETTRKRKSEAMKRVWIERKAA